MDTDGPIKLTRKQLYDEVWSEPMTKLAVRYGMSDVGLAKICNRHQIPKPKVGYWTKVQHGHKVKKPKLPEVENEEPIIIHRTEECIGREDPELLTQVYAHYDFEALEENRIVVPDELTTPHPVTKRLQKALRKAHKTSDGIYHVWEHPKIEVSKEQMPHVLRIIDTLAKALAERQFDLDHLVIFGAEIKIFLKEVMDSQLKPGAKEEMEQDSWRSGYRSYDYERTPSGRLQISIDDRLSGKGFQRNWRDGKTRCIESLLNDFVCGMVRHAAYERERELYWERVHREWAEEERRREEAARRAAEAERRREELYEQAEGWKQARLIRRFVEAAIERAGSADATEEFSEWVQWACTEADWIDPLVKQ